MEQSSIANAIKGPSYDQDFTKCCGKDATL